MTASRHLIGKDSRIISLAVSINLKHQSAKYVCYILLGTQSKNAVCAFQITLQTTFFYLGRFLKKVKL